MLTTTQKALLPGHPIPYMKLCASLFVRLRFGVQVPEHLSLQTLTTWIPKV